MNAALAVSEHAFEPVSVADLLADPHAVRVRLQAANNLPSHMLSRALATATEKTNQSRHARAGDVFGIAAHRRWVNAPVKSEACVALAFFQRHLPIEHMTYAINPQAIVSLAQQIPPVPSALLDQLSQAFNAPPIGDRSFQPLPAAQASTSVADSPKQNWNALPTSQAHSDQASFPATSSATTQPGLSAPESLPPSVSTSFADTRSTDFCNMPSNKATALLQPRPFAGEGSADNVQTPGKGDDTVYPTNTPADISARPSPQNLSTRTSSSDADNGLSFPTNSIKLVSGGRAACGACNKIVKRISLLQHTKHGQGCRGVALTEQEYAAIKKITSSARAAYMRKYREPKMPTVLPSKEHAFPTLPTSSRETATQLNVPAYSNGAHNLSPKASSPNSFIMSRGSVERPEVPRSGMPLSTCMQPTLSMEPLKADVYGVTDGSDLLMSSATLHTVNSTTDRRTTWDNRPPLPPMPRDSGRELAQGHRMDTRGRDYSHFADQSVSDGERMSKQTAPGAFATSRVACQSANCFGVPNINGGPFMDGHVSPENTHLRRAGRRRERLPCDPVWPRIYGNAHFEASTPVSISNSVAEGGNHFTVGGHVYGVDPQLAGPGAAAFVEGSIGREDSHEKLQSLSSRFPDCSLHRPKTALQCGRTTEQSDDMPMLDVSRVNSMSHTTTESSTSPQSIVGMTESRRRPRKYRTLGSLMLSNSSSAHTDSMSKVGATKYIDKHRFSRARADWPDSRQWSNLSAAEVAVAVRAHAEHSRRSGHPIVCRMPSDLSSVYISF